MAFAQNLRSDSYRTCDRRSIDAPSAQSLVPSRERHTYRIESHPKPNVRWTNFREFRLAETASRGADLRGCAIILTTPHSGFSMWHAGYTLVTQGACHYARCSSEMSVRHERAREVSHRLIWETEAGSPEQALPRAGLPKSVEFWHVS